MMSLDLTLFHAINGVASQFPILGTLAVFFAAYSQYGWLAILAAACLWPSARRGRYQTMMLVGSMAALVARMGVKTAIVMAWARERPYGALPGVRPLIPIDPSEALQSFPSGHALFFFALATVIYHGDRRAGRWALGAAAVMGIARVAVGVHWPSDIVVGAILGIGVGWLTTYLWTKKNSKKN